MKREREGGGPGVPLGSFAENSMETAIRSVIRYVNAVC